MSRTFKKDKFGKTSTRYRVDNLYFRCRCEYCKNPLYKLKNTINKQEITKIINDTNYNNVCSNAIRV